MSIAATPPEISGQKKPAPERRHRRRTSLFAHGEPMVWLTGASLAIGIFMIVGLLWLVLVNGMSTFWAEPVVKFTTATGEVKMGEVFRSETFTPTEADLAGLPPEVRERAERELQENEGLLTRRLVRTENYELTGTHFHWVNDFAVEERAEPEWAMVVERQAGGRFYGFPDAFLVDGEEVATGPEGTWEKIGEYHEEVRDRFHEMEEIEEDELGHYSDMSEKARLTLRQVELDHGEDSPEYREAEEEYREELERISEERTAVEEKLSAIAAKNDPYRVRMRTADGMETTLTLEQIVRIYPANQYGFFDRLGLYLSRWGEFLSAPPREANAEGGVFPAIYGTVLMTLIMAILVVPFGVLAALYLREYAKSGPLVSTVRIAINNLAGVPSIVFGVFGLGFFCYVVGAGIDEMFFEARLPNPTFGKSGLVWASLTLALLTLPVVIVATEEALAAVPGSMREGSYACGASKWQTIRRIVLPRAAPGIMTGMILAVARAAGEVAPLMLVGAIKFTESLPGEIDSIAPYVHVERSFMHLGFHIYDLGFQSPNADAAKPMVYTTTLLLIGIVVALNVAAILIRSRLRKKFEGGHF